MKKPKISIVVLNWNGWKDTIECLESLFSINYPNYEVIVVDNNSTNGSVEKIKDYLDGRITVQSKFFDYDSSNKPIKYLELSKKETEDFSYKKEIAEFDDLPSNKKAIIIRNDSNYGFSAGNNVAIKWILERGKSDYVNTLNNDTIVHRDYLNGLINGFDEYKNVGVTGPKIYFYDYTGKCNTNKRDKIIWFAGARRDYLRGSFKQEGICKIDSPRFNKIKEVPFITGCCQLIKKEVFEKIGFYPTEYYLYFDDVDFCHKVSTKYRMLYCPKSKIRHKISASTKHRSLKHIYYFNRARLIYLIKYFDIKGTIPLLFFISTRLFMLLGYLLTFRISRFQALLDSLFIWDRKKKYSLFVSEDK